MRNLRLRERLSHLFKVIENDHNGARVDPGSVCLLPIPRQNMKGRARKD